MPNFADALRDSIEKTGSHLVAGCDPVLENLPAFLLEEGRLKTQSDADLIARVLDTFVDIFLAAVEGKVPAIKPNIAFFERYGLPGVTSYARLINRAPAAQVRVIADAKRGDIGSTAAAYSAAFLGRSRIGASVVSGFPSDAVTVNPFLGFDTLEPFLADCQEYGKGIFVLVQTSNPGAKDLQGIESGGVTVSERVATWLARNAERLRGECGWSGLGAVVGASYPEEAKGLRELMPTNLFLVPGMGAQGASAQDAVAGCGSIGGVRGGALVNVSRGLLEGSASSAEELHALISSNVDRFNEQLNRALES